MIMRRGSTIYRSELARLIEQFVPGSRVLCVYNNCDNGVIGIVENVNTVENKVYVAWNGGPVKQHDPDELMLAVIPVDESEKEAEQLIDSVENNPVDETIDDNSDEIDNIVDIVNTSGRRMAVYHSDRGRVYRRTRRERDENIISCPKCRNDMELRPFTKNERIYVCPRCDWKISTSKVL